MNMNQKTGMWKRNSSDKFYLKLVDKCKGNHPHKYLQLKYTPHYIIVQSTAAFEDISDNFLLIKIGKKERKFWTFCLNNIS